MRITSGKLNYDLGQSGALVGRFDAGCSETLSENGIRISWVIVADS